MYENFGKPKSSAQVRMVKAMSSVDKWEKDSGNIHLSVRICKKILDGKEAVTITISKGGAKDQEFTSLESFSESIKTIVSGLKAKL